MSRILLVDGDPIARSFYREELANDGHTVATAVDADEALLTLALETPHLVVLEIGAPCGNGLETMERILALHRGVPIVLHTTYTSYQDDFRCWAADAYVVKSSDTRELRRNVRALLITTEGSVSVEAIRSGKRSATKDDGASTPTRRQHVLHAP